MTVTRVLIVDDQAMIRVGLRAILGSQDDLDVVGEAADGRVAVEQVRALRPDLVLMDVRMPGTDGLQAARTMLGPTEPAAHRPRILMLTTFDVDDHVYEALRAGASGFLLKDTDPEELLKAVRTVAGGESMLSPSVTRRLIERFVGSPQVPVPARSTLLEDLTDREQQVMRLVALGLSNTEISARLFIAEQTTKSHVSRILAKLDLRDRVQAVVFAYEHGLITPGQARPD